MQTQKNFKSLSNIVTKKRKFSNNSTSTNETESADQQFPLNQKNTIFLKQKSTKTEKQKFKTQLCKNYSETGHCPYRKKCKFAHGSHQLKDQFKQVNTHYRTKKCHSFWNEGVCKYGSRCQFFHQENGNSKVQFLMYWKFAIENKQNEFKSAESKLMKILSN